MFQTTVEKIGFTEECNTYSPNNSIEKVILGEATILSAFILKNNQRLTKASYVQLSRMTSSIIEYESEEWKNEENLVDPLLKNLILLRSRLNQERIISLNISYIKPFCDVIVNKDVSGPVTGLALQSIQKFLNYGFIKDDEIVRLIGESVTKARFVGTDSNSDETVLMTILSVLESLIVMPFYSLTNGIICEIMQSCFRIAFESRLSELLRKCAVKSLTEMVRALFTRISTFDKEHSDYNYFYHDKNNASFHKLNRMGKRFVGHHQNKHNKKMESSTMINKHFKINKEDISDFDSSQKTHGLACVHELLSYLTSLINPLPDGQNVEYMINVGLHLLTVIFEISVREIGSKYCLLSVVKTDLCWNIMQLLQHEKNLNTFASVLRLAFLLFVDLRMHLKYQFEAFLLRLMDIIATVNTPLEYRDICMEYLLLFFRHILYLPHELFFNFDCDPYSSNILEDLLQLLSKNCFATSTNNQQNVPTSPTSSSSNLNFTALQILSFEVLLSNLKNLQMAELYKDKEIYLTANPATMIVNISNIRDVFPNEKSSNNKNEYDICTMYAATTETMVCNNNNNHREALNKENSSLRKSQEKVLNKSISNATTLNTIVTQSDISNESENFEIINNSNQNLNSSSDSNIEFINRQQQQQQQEMEQNTPMINKYCVTYLFPQKSSLNLVNSEQIQVLKQRKSLLWTATEKFNQKPSKGIEYLYENKLVQNDDDVVAFLRNNSRLDKKSLGEYLSNKKNMTVLSKFVQSFIFKDIRIDEALRLYLESFRLPGEAPLISLVLEQFAHHWHESNGCPFVNEDAAFSLAYAIIMLNVDQHNSNVKRQTNPMTCEEFISNLRQVNGGKDFDRDMLMEIYMMIKNNEIIMPAEQQGIVREKYLWKCLLKNSETLNGVYWFYSNLKTYREDSAFVEQHFKNTNEDYVINLSIFNMSIFEISWSPSISTLTLVFDKLNPDRQPSLSQRVLNQGFTSCSLLCANYGHLDNLIENLSKFVIASPRITNKSELVAYCLFGICKEYANEMRGSWRNIIVLILFWYDNKLLDDGFEIDDFALESKKISFARKTPLKSPKQPNENNQSTFLSSFYSYFASNSPNDQDISVHNTNNNNDVMGDCGSGSNLPTKTNLSSTMNRNDYCRTLLLIIEESKFLHIDSLIELIKALIQVEYCDTFDDDIEVFKMEILLKVIFMNRDRLSIFWDLVYRHIIKLMRYCPQSEYLTERIISTIFRLAIRFTSRPDLLNNQIFLLLYQMLLFFDPYMIQRIITAQTLHSFISHCNCYFIKNEEWALIFNLILAVSIGYFPQNKKLSHVIESSDHASLQRNFETNLNALSPINATDLSKFSAHLNVKKNLSENIFSFNYPYRILDAEAYEKCVDIMVLIIREYLPNNAKTLRKNDSIISVYEIAQMAGGVLFRFVEASIKIQFSTTRSGQNLSQNKNYKTNNQSRLSRLTNAILSSSESDSEDELQQGLSQPVKSEVTSVTENVALKLLDLMHYFHLHAPTITGDQVSSDVLWNTIWCPLLQAIAFFCCDCRRPVRTCAFTFLQRTLLLHDLQVLNAVQWESCFNKVLFPLLSKLLEPINMCDPIGMDETRMRTTNLLCKVFLQHLNPLLTLNTFTALWLTILDFMHKYIKADMQTELVKEAIPESLKNILLVMKTAGCFNETLASITWDRINIFLPNLYCDLIEPHIKHSEQSTILTQSDSSTTFEQQHQYEYTTNSSTKENFDSHTTNGDHRLEKEKEVPISGVDNNVNNPINRGVSSCEDQKQHTSQLSVIPSYSNNLPSTFIDMESVYVYSEQQQQCETQNIQNSKSTHQSSYLVPSTNVIYPGTIAQYYPGKDSMVQSTTHPLYSSMMDVRNPLSQPGGIGRTNVSSTIANSNTNNQSSSSSYPWPMPNLTDDSFMNQ